MSDSSLDDLLSGSGLGSEATQSLALTADTFGPAITAALGDVTIAEVDAAEVMLVTLLIDDSSSIEYAGNEEAVRQGHNEVLTALAASRSSAQILICCRYLNGTVLYPYVALQNAIQMDRGNYNAYGNTPLYDMSAVTLAGVTAKMADLEQGGVAVKSVTYFITDGQDAGSRHHRAGTVRPIVEALLRTESHIIGAVGIRDRSAPVDFEEVFRDMGIPERWVLTTGNSQSEIRRAFGTVSQSAVRVSQSANLQQAKLGGFGS